MLQNKYKIKNNKTGLYFNRFILTRGLTKTGKPRKSGPAWFVAAFDKFENVSFLDIGYLNYSIKFAIENNVHDFFDNCEIEAYKMQPTKTTLKLEKARRRIEANVIMEKLKA